MLFFNMVCLTVGLACFFCDVEGFKDGIHGDQMLLMCWLWVDDLLDPILDQEPTLITKELGHGIDGGHGEAVEEILLETLYLT
jgi:hypothetical protein